MAFRMHVDSFVALLLQATLEMALHVTLHLSLSVGFLIYGCALTSSSRCQNTRNDLRSSSSLCETLQDDWEFKCTASKYLFFI